MEPQNQELIELPHGEQIDSMTNLFLTTFFTLTQLYSVMYILYFTELIDMVMYIAYPVLSIQQKFFVKHSYDTTRTSTRN